MKTVGSRAEVWHGTAKKTSGGLLKKDLKKNKRGRIVSKKMSNRAKKEKRLEKAGYKTKKGVFKKFKAKKKGGMNGNGNGNKSSSNNKNNGVALAAEKFQKTNNNYNKNTTTAMLRRVANARPPGSIKTMENGPYKHMLSYLSGPNISSLYVHRNKSHHIKPEMNKRILNMLKKKHGNINKALIEAVKKGNQRDVRILLNAGADKEANDEYGRTPLHVAAWEGQTDIVRMLLDEGADKEARDNDFMTPLHYAAWNGHTDIVMMLLAAGADKDVWNEDGMTPLHCAAFGGHTDIVRLLLDAGADKEVKDVDGRTPLHEAEEKGHTDIVNLLKSRHKSKGGSKKRRKRKTTKRKTTQRKSKK